MNMFGLNFSFSQAKPVPYKVGLALGGGGARGVAHCGVLKAMQEIGLKPDIIAGVSAGSIAAAMYSAGLSPDHMVTLFEEARFGDFCEWKMPSDGLFRIDRFRAFLRKHIPYERIEDLPIPVVIVATNLDTGQRTAFEKGPLADCIAASCSIPIVFEPAVIDGVRYVDGGVLGNLPAWALRDRCKFLMGVNVSPLSRNFKPANNLLDIALHSYRLMSKNNTTHDMAICDLTIKTDEIADYKVFDLKGVRHVYRSGYNDAMRCFEAHGVRPKRPCRPPVV